MNPQLFEDSILVIPLFAVILGLVTWSEGIGVKGKWKFVLSMVIGIVFGGLYQFLQHPPASAFDWFAGIFYGVALGLVASGLYDTAKRVVSG